MSSLFLLPPSREQQVALSGVQEPGVFAMEQAVIPLTPAALAPDSCLLLG